MAPKKKKDPAPKKLKIELPESKPKKRPKPKAKKKANKAASPKKQPKKPTKPKAKKVKKPQEYKKISGLSEKQSLFIFYYVGTLNATRAAALAGYKGSNPVLRSIGSENLTKPNIREAVRERLALVVMEPSEVVARLTKIAEGFDPAEYMIEKEHVLLDSNGNEYDVITRWGIDLNALKADGYGIMIKSITNGRYGPNFVFHDPQVALRELKGVWGLEISTVLNLNSDTKDPDSIDEALNARKKVRGALARMAARAPETIEDTKPS